MFSSISLIYFEWPTILHFTQCWLFLTNYSSFNLVDSFWCCCNLVLSISTSIINFIFCWFVLSRITSSLLYFIKTLFKEIIRWKTELWEKYLVLVAIRILDDKELMLWIGVFGNSKFHCWMIRVLRFLDSAISFPSMWRDSRVFFAFDKRSRKADKNLFKKLS